MHAPTSRIPLALALLAGALPVRAVAQTGPEANLVLTVAAGVVTGGALWTVARQPFCPAFTGGSCANTYDTLRLSRATGSSIIVGASVTYFPSPVLGLQGDITYLGFPLDDACTVVNTSPTRLSEQICGSVRGQSITSGAVSFFGGVVARATPRRAISPYARVGIGLVAMDQSTVDMAGADSTGQLYGLLVDDSPQRVAVGAVLAAGLTVPLGVGYQFRFEARDVVSRFNSVAGAADVTLRPPIDNRFLHHFALTMGLDVVLEHKRGRRY